MTTIVQPPPAYKTTTSTGRKQRIRSEGEITPGPYYKSIRESIPRGKRCTFAGSKTKLNKYSDHKLKYYGDITHYNCDQNKHEKKAKEGTVVMNMQKKEEAVVMNVQKKEGAVAMSTQKGQQ